MGKMSQGWVSLACCAILGCSEDSTTPAPTPTADGGTDAKPADDDAGCTGEECPPVAGSGSIIVGCSTFKDRATQNITVALLDGTTVVDKKTSAVGPGTGTCRFTFAAQKDKDYGLRFYVDQNANGQCEATDYVVKMADVNLTKLMTNDITIGIGENYPVGDCVPFQ